MAKRKSVCSVRESTEMAFKNMSDEFCVLKLIEQVRYITNRPVLTDGSILRRLRELRADNELNYRCIDSEKSIYKKLEIQNLKSA